jgi:Peptidase propeptide and YPEB domain
MSHHHRSHDPQHDHHGDEGMQSCRCHKKWENGSKSNDATDTSNTGKTPLSLAQIITKVEELGYTGHASITRKGDCYKIVTSNANGDVAELYVDTQSGKTGKQEDEITPPDKTADMPIEKSASASSAGPKRKKNANTAKAARAGQT